MDISEETAKQRKRLEEENILVDPNEAGSSKQQLRSDQKHKMKASTAPKSVGALPHEEPAKKRRRFDKENILVDASEAGSSKQLLHLSSDQKYKRKAVTLQKSVDDLAPEVLDAVLSLLTTDDLLNSRQVNCKWNELSSRILRTRKDKMLRFCFENGRYMQTIKFNYCGDMGHSYGSNCIEGNKTLSKSLTDFIDCFKDSTHFPYTQFDFGDLEHFEAEDITKFLSIWGKNIQSLKITMLDPTKSVEFLRKLLLEQVLNLKKLEIDFGAKYWSSEQVSSLIQLFPDSKKFKLPHLEILVVDSHYRKYRAITKDIIEAAVNLKKFVCIASDLRKEWNSESVVQDSITTEDLQMLQSLNKLHCLKTLEICLSEELITYWGKYLKNVNLKLESLYLSFGDIWKYEHLKFGATSVINQLFEYSKDLIELGIESSGSLSDVVFPKFEKLYKLVLWPTSVKSTMFPQLFQMADVFPNLHELGWHLPAVDNFFPSSQPLLPMPSIQVFRIFYPLRAKYLHKLMQMTPNVLNLYMIGHDNTTLAAEFRAILNNLPKLTTFGWAIQVITHHDLLFSLDAAITGLPEKLCRTLSAKFKNKDHLSVNKLAAIAPLREHASILHLKDLKQFEINFIFDYDTYCEMDMDESDFECECSDCDGDCESCDFRPKTDEAGHNKNTMFYKTGFTKVSELLGFKLMPNLKIRIHKYFD